MAVIPPNSVSLFGLCNEECEGSLWGSNFSCCSPSPSHGLDGVLPPPYCKDSGSIRGHLCDTFGAQVALDTDFSQALPFSPVDIITPTLHIQTKQSFSGVRGGGLDRKVP